MAGLYLHATSGEVAAGNGKTILQVVAAANDRIKISGWGVSFKGTSATDIPILVTLLRQTTAGTMSAGSAGVNISKKNNSDAETVQTTTQINATVEPTAGDILANFEIHPQTGNYWYIPSGQEYIVPNGGRIAIKVTSAALTYSCTAEMDVEE